MGGASSRQIACRGHGGGGGVLGPLRLWWGQQGSREGVPCCPRSPNCLALSQVHHTACQDPKAPEGLGWTVTEQRALQEERKQAVGQDLLSDAQSCCGQGLHSSQGLPRVSGEGEKGGGESEGKFLGSPEPQFPHKCR